MNVFRRLSSRRLAVSLAAVAATGVVAAAVSVAAFGGGGAAPPPEPLPQAIHDALTAAPVDGVTARISFTNHLLASSSLGALGGGSGSPLLSGASGRLWLTNDGELRLELQSDAGDAQILSDGKTLTVYDASTNTAYELALPDNVSEMTSSPNTPPSLAQIDDALTQLAGFADVSGPSPDSVAGQPAYTVKVSPKESGGLVDSTVLSWDAATGVPLRFAIFARGDSSPVLDLTATDISYGPVAASDVDISPPAGAKLVTVNLPSAGGQTATPAPVTGLDAVAAALPFQLAAPAALDGLARNTVRLTGSADDIGALVTYGQGLGTIAVTEHAAQSTSGPAASPLDQLPSVSINGTSGHELSTALGTVVAFTSGTVSFVVAGSVTQGDAEAAARALVS